MNAQLLFCACVTRWEARQSKVNGKADWCIHAAAAVAAAAQTASTTYLVQVVRQRLVGRPDAHVPPLPARRARPHPILNAQVANVGLLSLPVARCSAAARHVHWRRRRTAWQGRVAPDVASYLLVNARHAAREKGSDGRCEGGGGTTPTREQQSPTQRSSRQQAEEVETSGIENKVGALPRAEERRENAHRRRRDGGLCRTACSC